MQRIILTKTSQTPNIAHLYEHIYVAQLDTFLNSHHFYRYLDYQIDARTYPDGLIYIDASLFFDETDISENQLLEIKLLIDTDSINGALWQVSAEKRSEIFGQKGNIKKCLKVIDNQPWVPIKNLTMYNSETCINPIDFKYLPLTANHFKQLKCEIILDSKFAVTKPEYIPLFTVLAYILIDNISVMLADDFYYFGTGNDCLYEEKSAKEIANFITRREQNNKLTDELSACQDLVQKMKDNGFLVKLSRQLQCASPQKIAPDELKIYQSTGKLVGQQGWKNVAKETNIQEILNNIKLKISFGKVTQAITFNRLT